MFWPNEKKRRYKLAESLAGSSPTRAAHPDAVVFQKFRGKYVPHHIQTHRDCIILPRPSGYFHQNIAAETKNYIKNKLVEMSKPFLFPD